MPERQILLVEEIHNDKPVFITQIPHMGATIIDVPFVDSEKRQAIITLEGARSSLESIRDYLRTEEKCPVRRIESAAPFARRALSKAAQSAVSSFSRVATSIAKVDQVEEFSLFLSAVRKPTLQLTNSAQQPNTPFFGALVEGGVEVNLLDTGQSAGNYYSIVRPAAKNHSDLIRLAGQHNITCAFSCESTELFAGLERRLWSAVERRLFRSGFAKQNKFDEGFVESAFQDQLIEIHTKAKKLSLQAMTSGDDNQALLESIAKQLFYFPINVARKSFYLQNPEFAREARRLKRRKVKERKTNVADNPDHFENESSRLLHANGEDEIQLPRILYDVEECQHIPGRSLEPSGVNEFKDHFFLLREELDSDDRELLDRLRNDESVETIAADCGVSTGAIRVRKHRLMEKLHTRATVRWGPDIEPYRRRTPK